MLERLAENGIANARVLNAFGWVPRHVLIPDALHAQAYQDTALPIGEGQTISAPGIVAAMTQALELDGPETVLEIGTGSGYQAAILAQLASRVVSVERVPRLAALARRTLDRLGVSTVAVYLGDGTRGRPDEAPFEAIVVTAGGPSVPEPLLDQLCVGGRLVGPFGDRDEQRLIRIRRLAANDYTQEVSGRCRFVDLIGAHGWVG